MTHYHILKYNNMKKIYSFIAMAALVAMPVFTACDDKGGDETSADKTALEAEIAECQDLLDNATTSDYPETAITEFEEIINTVKEAAAGDITQTVANNLLAQLQAAKDSFLSQAYGFIPEENLLLSFDFETEDNPQVSTGTLAYEAAFATGPESIFGSDATNPTFVEGVNGGKAISFANGSHLEIAKWSQNELLKNEVSISVWVNPTAMVPGNYIFGVNYWNTLKMNVQNEGKPFLTIHTEGNAGENPSLGADCDNEIPQSVVTDKWTHLVVTVSLTNDEMNFYVDGELTKTWDESGKPALAGTSWSTYTTADGDQLPITIGTTTTNDEAMTWDWLEATATYWNENVGFNGAIDNLKIYDIALTAGQVSGLYSSELGK